MEHSAWKPFRKRYRWAANVEWFLGTTDMVFPYVLIAASLVYGIINPFFMLKYLAFVILFSGIMQTYYCMREKNRTAFMACCIRCSVLRACGGWCRTAF